jgi:D-alanyl-D-alanine carboxypeptidase
MPKKLLTILGILLLLGVSIIGIWTFVQRHNNKELIPDSRKSSSSTQKISSGATDNDPEPVVPAFNKSRYSLSDPTSIWVVVNKQRPLDPMQYAPADLVAVGNNQQLRKEASDALAALIATAKAEGLTISPLSGYRSYSRQVTVYDNEVKNYGQAVADTESAKPGHSEHQTGLAIDVGGGGCNIDDCFANTAEGKWVATNAYKYGYIVRYAEGKQAITGYRYEPWHLRYVGTELAEELHAQNVTTLEEFFEL